MGRYRTGEVVSGEIQGLEAAAELEGLGNLAGELHRLELERDDAVLFLVPAGDAGELANRGGCGVREGPGGEA